MNEFRGGTFDGVFYIGHASALVRLSGHTFFFDPAWNHVPYGQFWKFVPEQINCEPELRTCHSAFVSHIHADHVCEEILKKVKVVSIMGGRQPLEDRLCSLGIVVMMFEPWKWYKVVDDVEVLFVKHPFNEVDSAIIIRNSERTFYHGNDTFLDLATIEKIKSCGVDRFDVAMVPYAFIHWYPHLMKNLFEAERILETKRLNRQSIDQYNLFKAAFAPTVCIPFGANLYYDDGLDHVLNRALATPFDVEEDPLLTGDWVGWIPDIRPNVPSTRCVFRKERHNKDSYEQLLDRSLTNRFPEMEFSTGGRPWKEELEILKRKVESAETTVKGHQIVVNGIVIDLEHKKIFQGKPTKSYLAFVFDRGIFWEWLQGEITFEQAIGTRRFECRREPQIYNLAVFEWMNRWL